MSSSQEQYPKWYLAYFFLAVFDILTVSVSLYFNHMIMGFYAGSVSVNREWATRLGQLAELRELAGDVNAPGNDVFDSHDVAGESARMSTTLRRFNEKLAIFRHELNNYVSESETELLAKDLDSVEVAINEMTEEASQIFLYFSQKQPDQAGKHMASMDRKYARVHAGFARVGRHIRVLQQQWFDQQRTRAADMQKFEYLIAAFIVVMVVGASLYGHRVYRQMRIDTQEKERFLQMLQEKEERYRLLVDGVKDQANIILDPNGYIISWNDGAERLHGYQAEETLGKDSSRLYPSDGTEKERVKRLLLAVETAGTVEEEGWHLRKDNSRFWGEEVITSLHDESGQLRGFSKIIRDITERKQVQEKLQKANARLQEIDQLRTQFFADISHELRTPLTVLRGEAEVTLRGKDKAIVEYKTTLERIVQLTKQVDKLVNDLFFLARSESGIIQIEKQAIQIHDVLNQVISDGRILAKKKSLTLNFTGQDSTMVVQGDPQRLRQLFMIVLDNAVTYTKPGGVININMERAGNYTKVAVSDNGIGISPESISQVFKRFYRAPQSRAMVQHGTGLGLSIAKWVTEAHQGTISLTSSSGEGTTVSIRLPLIIKPGT